MSFTRLWLKVKNKWKFIGKCKLIHWYDDENTYYKNKIYLGKENEKGEAIHVSDSEKDKINKIFNRNEYGTSQFILLPFMPEKNWKEIYFKTILRNYWMMIDQNQLAVEIHSLGDLEMEINSENIKELMNKTFKDYNKKEIKPDHPLYGNPLEFYNVYKNNKPHITKIDHIGKIEVFFKSFTDEENPPPAANQCRVSYVRGNMLIQNKRYYGPGKFMGIMMCKDRIGNEVLKEMEPPKHDKFEYELLNKKNITDINGKKVTADIGKKILNQIRDYIKDIATMQKITEF